MAKLVEQLKLARGLWVRERVYNDPFFVGIDLTKRCNLHCLGCKIHGRDAQSTPGGSAVRDISFELATRLLKELGSMSCRSVTFIGEGEPLLYHRLMDLIAVAKSSGMQVTLVTNGSLLDEETVNALIEVRLDDIKVSLWASCLEEYQQNYLRPDAANFQRTLDGLHLLKQIKAEKRALLPRVRIHEPIDRYNFGGVRRMAEMARELECASLTFAPLVTQRGKFDEDALSPEQEQQFTESLLPLKAQLTNWAIGHNIDETLLRYRIGERAWEKLPCYMAWLYARVKIDGTVLPCVSCDVSMGDLNQSTFREIWNGAAYREFRKRAMTKDGLATLGQSCDCAFCCHVPNNARVHKYYRWLAPLSGLRP